MKKKARKVLSVMLTLAMLLGLMPGMNLTVIADNTVTEWHAGDTFSLQGKYCVVDDFPGDIEVELCGNTACTVPEPSDEWLGNYNQWTFSDCYYIDAEDDFYKIYITIRPDKTQADVPTGFRIKSGTGINNDPYIFELVYADDVPGDAVAATVNANELTYDGTEQSLVTVTGEANGGTMQYALGTATEATEPYSTTVPEGKDAGTYYVWYKAVGDASHNDSEEGQVSVTISPRDLAITAKAAGKTYGDADPELEYEENGLVSGDSITGNLVRGEGETVGSYAISQGTLTAGDNYNIRYTGAVFTIGKKSIRITADSVSKTYGEDDPELTYTVEGLVDGDSLTGGLERTQGEDSGTYAINQGTLGGDNYEVESFTNGVFTIEKADSSMEEPTANVLTYNGGPQPLLASPGSTEDGTMLDSTGGPVYGLL